MTFSFLLVLGAVVLLLLRHWFRGRICPCSARLDGRVVVVTGASSGIGRETALELARRGARLIVLCRKSDKANEVKSKLKLISPDNELVELDLNSKRQIEECSRRIHQLVQRVDVLVNNAGLISNSEEFTEDGYETTLQSNHLGHFYLTQLLFDLLRATDSKVINVSSLAHRMNMDFPFSPVKFEPDMYERGKVRFTKGNYYSQSKLANMLFTKQLARRCLQSGVNCSVYALHPGVVYTEIMHGKMSPYLRFQFLAYVLKSSFLGAQTSIFLCAESKDKLESGGYYDDCHRSEQNPSVFDQEVRLQFWSISERFAGKKFDL